MRNALTLLLTLLLSALSLAVTCESTPIVQRSTFSDSPVFLGRVVVLNGQAQRGEDGREHGASAEIEIEKRFWGVPKSVPDRIKIVSMGGYDSWTPGEEYLVVAMPILPDDDGSEMAVSDCTPTRALSDSRVGLRTVRKSFCDKPGGTIVGQVWDTNSKTRIPLPNVQVRIVDQKGRVTVATTDDEGIYAVHHLPLGSYRINAQVPASAVLKEYQTSEREVEEAGECVDGSQEFAEKINAH